MLSVRQVKAVDSKIVSSEKTVWQSPKDATTVGAGLRALPQPVFLRLRREARGYLGGLLLGGLDDPQWIDWT